MPEFSIARPTSDILTQGSELRPLEKAPPSETEAVASKQLETLDQSVKEAPPGLEDFDISELGPPPPPPGMPKDGETVTVDVDGMVLTGKVEGADPEKGTFHVMSTNTSSSFAGLLDVKPHQIVDTPETPTGQETRSETEPPKNEKTGSKKEAKLQELGQKADKAADRFEAILDQEGSTTTESVKGGFIPKMNMDHPGVKELVREVNSVLKEAGSSKSIAADGTINGCGDAAWGGITKELDRISKNPKTYEKSFLQRAKAHLSKAAGRVRAFTGTISDKVGIAKRGAEGIARQASTGIQAKGAALRQTLDEINIRSKIGTIKSSKEPVPMNSTNDLIQGLQSDNVNTRKAAVQQMSADLKASNQQLLSRVKPEECHTEKFERADPTGRPNITTLIEQQQSIQTMVQHHLMTGTVPTDDGTPRMLSDRERKNLIESYIDVA
ncbi:MAG: hypothetical protein KDK48_05665, partial [Chlamydiia bacterium]|nr:hypothetical protein [Chlamydiia bacterium]